MARVDVAGPRLFSFPNPVNEKAARAVAGGVLLLSSLTLALSVAFGGALIRLGVIPAATCEARNRITALRRAA